MMNHTKSKWAPIRPEREHTFRALDRRIDGDISKGQRAYYWNYRCVFFNHWRASDIIQARVYTRNQSSEPQVFAHQRVNQGRLERKEKTMRCTPEINMSPCHACLCIISPLPDISCSVFELRDEAGVVAPVADVLGDAAVVLSQGFSLSGETEGWPHLTLEIMFTHTNTHWATIPETKRCICKTSR